MSSAASIMSGGDQAEQASAHAGTTWPLGMMHPRCSMQSLRIPGDPKSNMSWTRRQVCREQRLSSAPQSTHFILLMPPAGLLYIDRVLYSSVVVSLERLRRQSTARQLFDNLFPNRLLPAVPPQLRLHPQDTV